MPLRTALLLLPAMVTAFAVTATRRRRPRTRSAAALTPDDPTAAGHGRLFADAESDGLVVRAWQAAGLGATESLSFTCDDGGTVLHCRLTLPADSGGRRLPVVLLLPTAIGSCDRFMHYKAAAVASEGYAAVVVDLFGDSTGKCWEADFNKPARALLVADRAVIVRRCDVARAGAAAAFEGIDVSRTAVLGWCFGGMCCMDVARACMGGVRGVVSFHGILDAAPPAISGTAPVRGPDIIAMTGDGDPYVRPDSIAGWADSLRQLGRHRWRLTTFSDAKHAFTRPEKLTAADAAAGMLFDEMADRESWETTLRELKAWLQ